MSIYEVKEVKDALIFAKRNPILRWHHALKHSLPIGIFWVVGILYTIISVVSCGMVMGFDQAFGGLIAVSAIVATSWLYVLYRE